MREIKINRVGIIKLDSIGLNEESADFSLIPRVYERDISRWDSADISRIRRGQGLELAEKRRYMGLVQYFSERERFSSSEMRNALGENRDIKFPCAFRLNDAEELEEHLEIIYQILHAHYMLGKNVNMLNKFPNDCCGISSSNIMFSALARGYANAVVAGNPIFSEDHWFVVFPFVLKNKEGVILADPTSDQLYPSLNGTAPRNLLRVHFGREWTYVTEWKGNCKTNEDVDLFPSMVIYPRIMKDFNFDKPWWASENYRICLDQAYQNLVDVVID